MPLGRPFAALLALTSALAVVGCGSHTGSLEAKSTEPHAAVLAEPHAAAMTEPGGSGRGGSGDGSGSSGGHEGPGDGAGGGFGGHEGSGGGNAHGIVWPVLGEEEHVQTASGEFVLKAADLETRNAQASGATHKLMRVQVEVTKGEGVMRPSDWFAVPTGAEQAPITGSGGAAVLLRPGESFEMTVDFPVSSQIAEVQYSPRLGASTAGEDAPTAGWVVDQY